MARYCEIGQLSDLIEVDNISRLWQFVSFPWQEIFGSFEGGAP